MASPIRPCWAIMAMWRSRLVGAVWAVSVGTAVDRGGMSPALVLRRRATAVSLPMSARVLAAADVYQAMTQPRTHRAALDADRCAGELRLAVTAGALDGDAVEAVLTVAGHAPVRLRREWPAGLSDRQVEVLRLVAEGLSNRDIGQRLSVTGRTAEHHVQDVYGKIGVSSRAAAALFAMEHHLLSGREGL